MQCARGDAGLSPKRAEPLGQPPGRERRSQLVSEHEVEVDVRGSSEGASGMICQTSLTSTRPGWVSEPARPGQRIWKEALGDAAAGSLPFWSFPGLKPEIAGREALARTCDAKRVPVLTAIAGGSVSGLRARGTEEPSAGEPRGGRVQSNSGERGSDQSDRPIGDLIKQLSEQTSTLVRKEMEFARAEMRQKGKAAGVGAGMFGGAGLFGLLALGALTACFILALAEATAGWLAALIVTLAYGALAGILALTGRTKVREAKPPVPTQAKESVREDLERIKERVTGARS
jgi:Putative Actinobacterial Holin-X, holin superfamily III